MTKGFKAEVELKGSDYKIENVREIFQGNDEKENENPVCEKINLTSFKRGMKYQAEMVRSFDKGFELSSDFYLLIRGVLKLGRIICLG